LSYNSSQAQYNQLNSPSSKPASQNALSPSQHSQTVFLWMKHCMQMRTIQSAREENKWRIYIRPLQLTFQNIKPLRFFMTKSIFKGAQLFKKTNKQNGSAALSNVWRANTHRNV